MSEQEGRKIARRAALEAAKRIRSAIPSSSSDDEEIQLKEEDEEEAYLSTEVPGSSERHENATTSLPQTSGQAVGQKKRGRKRKNEVTDPTLSPQEAQAMYELSRSINKVLKANPGMHDGEQKRRPGRPRKYEAAKPGSSATARRRRSINYVSSSSNQGKGVRLDSYQRRETYNSSVASMPFSSPQQLLPGNGGISYKESLMNFTKGLGTTVDGMARKMISDRLQRIQTRPQPWPQQLLQLQPLFWPQPSLLAKPLPEPQSWPKSLLHQQPWPQTLLQPQPQPFSIDVNLTGNHPVQITGATQAGQPLLSMLGVRNTERTPDAAAKDYKGKKVVIDDGEKKGKWDLGENLDFLLCNPKGGIRIRDSIDHPMSGTEDGTRGKNFANQQGGNKNIINRIGSFLSANQGALNRNNPKSFCNSDAGWELVEFLRPVQAAARKEGRPNTFVHPSTYLRPTTRRYSSSFLSLGGGATSLIKSIPPPPSNMVPPLLPELQPQQPVPSPAPVVRQDPELQIQDYAEGLFGKEAFSSDNPMIIGPLTRLMSVALAPEQPPTTPTIAAKSQLYQPLPLALTPSGRDATGEEELQLALASYMQMLDQEQNLLFQNPPAQNTTDMFFEPAAYGTIQPQPPPHIGMFCEPNFLVATPERMLELWDQGQGCSQSDHILDLQLQLGNSMQQQPPGDDQ